MLVNAAKVLSGMDSASHAHIYCHYWNETTEPEKPTTCENDHLKASFTMYLKHC